MEYRHGVTWFDVLRTNTLVLRHCLTHFFDNMPTYTKPKSDANYNSMYDIVSPGQHHCCLVSPPQTQHFHPSRFHPLHPQCGWVGGWVGGLHHPNHLLQVIAVCFDWAEYWVGRGVSDVRIFQVGTLQRPRPPPISRDRRGIASPLLVYSLLPLHDKWSPSGWLISLVQVQSIRLGERSIRSLWCTHRNSKCCCFTVWMAFYYGFLHRDTGPRGCLCLQSLQDRDGRWCNPQPMKSWLPCPRGRRRRPDNQPGKETMCMWALCSNTSRYLAKHPIQLFLKRWVDYFTAGLLIHNVERHERYL